MSAQMTYEEQLLTIETVIDRATAIYVSATVLGELYYGAEKSARRDENLK